MSYPETMHPYPSVATPIVDTYTVPAWPGGLHTIYILFSLDTYFGPAAWGESFNILTDSDSQTFTGAQLAGRTVAIASTNGVITFTVTVAGDNFNFYGYRIEEIVLANPRYVIGNPHSEDNPVGPVSDNDPTPKAVHTSVDLNLPRVLLAGQVNTAYTYPLAFPSGTVTSWAVTAGILPAGLTLNAATGVISGTPTAEQEAYFTVRCISSIPATVYANFIIRIYHAPFLVDEPQHMEGFFIGAINGALCHFHRYGARYCLVRPETNTAWELAIYKSLDDGATWARMDQANEPATPSGFAWAGSIVQGAVWDGADTIYCCPTTNFSGAGTMTITLQTFDLRTDTWQPTFGGTLAIATAGRFTGTIPMVILSSGSLRLFYQSAMTLLGVDHNLAAFGAPVLLQAPVGATGILEPLTVTYQRTSFVGAGTIDVTHIWYNWSGGGSSAVHYFRVDAALAVSGDHDAPAADYETLDFMGNAILDAATNSLVQGFLAKDPVIFGTERRYSPAVYRGAPLEAPVWTKEYVQTANPLDYMNFNVDAVFEALYDIAGRQAMIWMGAHDYLSGRQDNSFFVSYYDSANPTAKWTAREEFYCVVTNPWDDPNNPGNPVPHTHVFNLPLQDWAIYAEPDPQGGFYFVFQTENGGGPIRTSFAVLRFPRGHTSGGSTPAARPGNVAF